MSKKEEISDEEIVKIVIVNDQERYADIVERYQAALLRYARTILKDDDMAADAVQNAFIKAYRNLRSFNTNMKFSSWMYRIVHNESINLINKHKRELRPDDESWFDGLESNMTKQDDEMEHLLLQGRTAEALKELKDIYRDPLILYAFEAKTYIEISNILKIPTATVGTRIKRAKQQLKTELEKKGVSAHG